MLGLEILDRQRRPPARQTEARGRRVGGAAPADAGGGAGRGSTGLPPWFNPSYLAATTQLSNEDDGYLEPCSPSASATSAGVSPLTV